MTPLLSKNKQNVEADGVIVPPLIIYRAPTPPERKQTRNAHEISKKVTLFLIKFFLTLDQVNPINKLHQNGKKNLEPLVKEIFDKEEATCQYLYRNAIRLVKLGKNKNNAAINYIAVTILINSIKDDSHALKDFSKAFTLFSTNDPFIHLYKISVWSEKLEKGFKNISVSTDELAEWQSKFLISINWNLRLTELNLIDNLGEIS